MAIVIKTENIIIAINELQSEMKSKKKKNIIYSVIWLSLVARMHL